ncbi:Hypothetical predicted protein [Lynx pardinus]|uniref:Uncharacterized protein n=1 Tax=Lynx pardinus TaxID=191816 RepID=A0A485MCC9_LYNPA|nr:Hypothetical predicted protein [Lynx pardinus]
MDADRVQLSISHRSAQKSSDRIVPQARSTESMHVINLRAPRAVSSPKRETGEREYAHRGHYGGYTHHPRQPCDKKTQDFHVTEEIPPVTDQRRQPSGKKTSSLV